MFIEPHISGAERGWIEVICGSMFSGKTEELIRRLKRAKIANLKTKIFKPSFDVRFNELNITSHDENFIRSEPVNNAQEIIALAQNSNVIGIDETQFFNNDIINVCETLALQGIRVIIAGLDMDFSGKPFGPMPQLLAVADYITKLHAICVCCGNIANYSYRKTKQAEQFLLGETDIYEPRCRICYVKGETV